MENSNNSSLSVAHVAKLQDKEALAMRFLRNKDMLRVFRAYEADKIRSGKCLKFNVFTIVSDTFYHENFHSDVLAAFLDMRGTHGEGNLYLHYFMELLRFSDPKHSVQFDEAAFRNYETLRETDKIDITIRDMESRQALIIENKINNAVDQARQLPRYIAETESNGFEVAAVVYLSMDGHKSPSMNDWTNEERGKIGPLLVQVAASTKERRPDLLSHWIRPCLHATTNVDALIILRQYGRLLEHLGANAMNNGIMADFHKLLLEGDSFHMLITLREMLGRMPQFMGETIMTKYAAPRCDPFQKVWAFKPWIPVFEGFCYKTTTIAMDVVCRETSIDLEFLDRNWEKNGPKEVREVLESIGLMDAFTYNNDVRYIKSFAFPSEEEAMFDFIDRILLPKLKAIA